MLLHKFKKVPPIYFLNAPELQSLGQNLPPKKDVNVLPCCTVTVYS